MMIPAQDFRKQYLLRKHWRTDNKKWTSDSIAYWTTLEDAVAIQNHLDALEAGSRNRD